MNIKTLREENEVKEEHEEMNTRAGETSPFLYAQEKLAA
jgi:hypothetical protein